jgi:hypothetical protein
VGVVHVRLSDADMRAFAASEKRDPAIAKFHALQRQLAEQRGGLLLELWKLLQGRIFGLPWMMTTDDAAGRLGISQHEVQRLADDFLQEAMDAWAATPEYQQSPYRVMHERRAQGLPPLVPGDRSAPSIASDDSQPDRPAT